MESRKLLIPIKALNLHATNGLASLKMRILRSAWMAKDVHWIIFILSAYGGLLNEITYI